MEFSPSLITPESGIIQWNQLVDRQKVVYHTVLWWPLGMMTLKELDKLIRGSVYLVVTNNYGCILPSNLSVACFWIPIAEEQKWKRGMSSAHA